MVYQYAQQAGGRDRLDGRALQGFARVRTEYASADPIGEAARARCCGCSRASASRAKATTRSTAMPACATPAAWPRSFRRKPRCSRRACARTSRSASSLRRPREALPHTSLVAFVHRRSALPNFDRVVLMADGRVDAGTHEEVTARQPLLRAMIEAGTPQGGPAPAIALASG